MFYKNIFIFTIIKKMSLTNFYNIIGTGHKNKRDKTFKNHLIEPNSMILCIGGTGSGKSNSLINFLKLKNEAFYEIIIFYFYWFNRR